MKIIKKLSAFFTAAAMAAGAVPMINVTEAEAAINAASPQDIISKMGIGWNLGNSLDTNGTGEKSEEYWGNPKTTKELIEFVHDQGFSSIRIPVTWGYHMDAQHNIDASYMARVKEVIDYAYNDGMYVIINIHHDNFQMYSDYEGKNNYNYFYPDNAHKQLSETFVKSVWAQISETFKNYGERLVFETLNEPRLAGTGDEWWFPVDNPSSAVQEAVGVINTLNQDAVDVIRASGGNNANRLIMCPGYGASLDGAIVNGFALPNDTAGMVGVSIHSYTPYRFAMATEAHDNPTSVYNDEMKNELGGIFDTIKSRVIDRGYACYIGEFGATNKGNDAERCKWAKDYTAKAKALGIPVYLWDNNIYTVGSESYGLIKRTEMTVAYPEYLAALTEAYPVETPERLPGDVNNDGSVSIIDVLVLRQHLVGWQVDITLANADVNADNEANILDVLLIRQYLAGWDVVLK